MENNKLYLFNNDWGYSIGEIRRVNTKTVTMDTGDKIAIDKFNDIALKLSEEEELFYKGEMIKKLSDNTRRSLGSLLETLRRTETYLNNCEFVELNTEKLQKVIDEMTEQISNKSEMLIMNIQGKKVKLSNKVYDKRVEVIE